MKIRQIVIVILLTILTISAVSASEDIASDDNLTFSDEEVSIDSCVNDCDLESEDNSQPTVNYNPQIFTDEQPIIDIEGPSETSGNVALFNYNQTSGIIGSVVNTTTISNGKGQFVLNELTKGEHYFFLNMTFNGQQYNKTINFVVKDFQADSHIIPESINTNPSAFYDLAIVRIDNYHNLNGTIALLIDGTQYYNYYCDNLYWKYIRSYELNLPDSLKTGYHNVVLTYLKNGISKLYILFNNTIEFKYQPDISYYASFISPGESVLFNIKGMPGTSGTVTLYDYDPFNSKIGSVISTATLSNGNGQIESNSLPKGKHYFYFKIILNNQQYDGYRDIEVRDNSAGYSAKVSSKITVGQKAQVTFTSSKAKEPGAYVHIYVDGAKYKEVMFYGGTLSQSIGGLSKGQHKVIICYFSKDREHSSEYYYYKSFKVNVVEKAKSITITLKTVKVKKSAKKLVLSATLKISGKAQKSKKIIFKFNGKKFTAKTNKNGVAKVTVKKNILKKLKVGKKVKYQATYGTKTVKKSVIVKK